MHNPDVNISSSQEISIIYVIYVDKIKGKPSTSNYTK